MEKIENREICAKCGVCCKKCGCDYFVSDLESFKIDYIEEFLSKGNVSIVSTLDIKRMPNGHTAIIPFLYLRERNIGRDIIDLLSMKTTCSSLKVDGCTHDLNNRPSGGATVIPKENLQCDNQLEERLIELEKWRPHQKILARIVKRHTGLSVTEKLKQDILNLFIEYLQKNFENVSESEIIEMKELIPILIKAHPELYIEAKKRIKNKIIVLK